MANVLLKLPPLAPIVTEVPLVLRYDRSRGRARCASAAPSGARLGLALRRRLGRMD